MIAEKGKTILKKDRRIAYFSMEIGIEANIPTYSGGLGVLAGDTIRAFADLEVPAVAVTLVYERGYFYQKLNEQGEQRELPVQWNPCDLLQLHPEKVSVEIERRQVMVSAWYYDVMGNDGFNIPVIYLDTNLEENDEKDRNLTSSLYGGDHRYRIAQEIVLGIGGVRMLKKLGYTGIEKYHMNEGHSSFLALELLKESKLKKEGEGDFENIWDIEPVRDLCVFTTHTPVPAGHDQFPYDLVDQVLGNFVPPAILRQVGGESCLNMTLLALNFSKYVNGVAKKHGEVSQKMFPGYPIDSITNGVHSLNWTSESFARLYDKYIHGWYKNPFALRYSLAIPNEEIWSAHMEEKKNLIDYVNQQTNAGMSYKELTIGFARRSTEYKRAYLIFNDLQRLAHISNKVGKIQLIFAGKAHPGDPRGTEIIKKIFKYIEDLKGSVNIVYLQNYDMEVAKKLTSGVDIWLNTPQRPKEASGTSGMKAVHNGIPNFSVLDGWWLEGHIEGITGWSIGPKEIEFGVDENVRDAYELYEKLEKVIVPLYYQQRNRWTEIMRHSISINASFFNTHRMVQEYILNAYI